MGSECKFYITLFAAVCPKTGSLMQQLWLPIFGNDSQQVGERLMRALLKDVWGEFILPNISHFFAALGD